MPKTSSGKIQSQGWTQSGDRMSLKHKLLICVVFYGAEMAATFDHIYILLSLQYMGVPVYLLSVSATTSGLSALTVVPIIGHLVDSGKNPKRRKLVAYACSLVLFLTAYLLVATAGLVKLQMMSQWSPDDNGSQPQPRPSLSLQQTSTVSTTLVIEGNYTGTWSQGSDSGQLAGRKAGVPVYVDGVGNISSSVFLEQGSFSNNYTRGQIRDWTTGAVGVENITSWLGPNSSSFPSPSPSSSSSSSSSLPSTAFLAMIGFALIETAFDTGCPVLRAYLLANTDSESHSHLLIIATLMAAAGGTTVSCLGALDISAYLGSLFSLDSTEATLLVFCVALSTICTLGYLCTFLTAQYLNSKTRDSPTGPNLEGRFSDSPEPHTDIGVTGEKEYDPKLSLLLAEADTNSSPPSEDCDDKTLLIATQRKPTSYVSIGNGHSIGNGVSTLESLPQTIDTEKCMNSPKRCTTTPSNGHCARAEYLLNDSQENSAHTDKERQISPHAASCDTNSPSRGTYSFCSKRLVILFVSCFFTYTANLTFVVYNPNALTVGVFGGDPGSNPGTDAYHNYLKGQRRSAMGSFVMYLGYLSFSALNRKLLQIMGERAFFLATHAAMVVANFIFMYCQNEVSYFVAMVTFGAFRTCVFTLPYILANRYVHEEVCQTSGNGPPSDKSSHAGRAMSLMGTLLPLSSITVTSLMGPLMHQTGSVWVPIITSCGACSLSMLFFSLLLCL
ncbi:uncharacterized protein LOC101861722 [Aplysia californica]|uniref:Uncharacterized protein LOC101861722 n=1 Tax=Aplysia californica TaxID=6500 RepID=A0ABM0JK19_APLCA|nr:uncharacterized protein LOC101861722 [Aplysia californica]